MIAEAHALLSTTESLLASRRCLYAAAVDALPADARLRAAAPTAVDSPLFRGAVGLALGGAHATFSVDPVATRWPISRTCVALDEPVQVVDLPDADDVLQGVLAALDAGATGFLTVADSERFRCAVRLVGEGAALARSVSPWLVADLFPHVALLAVLDGRGDPRSVLSASLREYPGLLMLAEPRDALEAAEALLHEGAHARFFDMAIVHDLLPADSSGLPPFAPSWRPGVRWPLEQAFAALHAYAVLAEFHRDLLAAGPAPALLPSSLLDRADRRVAELGAWIEPMLPSLGRDAGTFVPALLGRPRVAGPASTPRAERGVAPRYAVQLAEGLVVHHEADQARTIASRPGAPARLYVLDQESGLVLDALYQHEHSPDPFAADPFDVAVKVYEDERNTGQDTAELAVSEIMELLAERSLVSLRKPKRGVTKSL